MISLSFAAAKMQEQFANLSLPSRRTSWNLRGGSFQPIDIPIPEFLRPPMQNRGPFLVLAAYFKMRRQQLAASSNGQDAVLSRLRWEFDSPRCYQVCVCVKVKRSCDAGSFNGRTRVFEARHERSIRSPAARFALNEVRGVVKATVTSLSQKTP